MKANICTVTVNASLTLYGAPVAYFCDSVTQIHACIITITSAARSAVGNFPASTYSIIAARSGNALRRLGRSGMVVNLTINANSVSSVVPDVPLSSLWSSRRRSQGSSPCVHVNTGLFQASGVTRVGVTRGGNWGCRPYFFLKKLAIFFAHQYSGVTPLGNVSPRTFLPVRPLCGLVCPLFFVNLPTFFSYGCHPLDSVTQGGPPPSDATVSSDFVLVSTSMSAVQRWRPDVRNTSVWNHNLTATLSDQLESYQIRALRIIYGDQIKGMPYQNALFLANLESLKDSRIKLSQSFFKKILSTDSCLHTLLPPERNN